MIINGFKNFFRAQFKTQLKLLTYFFKTQNAANQTKPAVC